MARDLRGMSGPAFRSRGSRVWLRAGRKRLPPLEKGRDGVGIATPSRRGAWPGLDPGRSTLGSSPRAGSPPFRGRCPEQAARHAPPARQGPAMKDFWLSCGHHLLDRDEGGGLVVTDEFLKIYLARPELAPPAEACAAERALHRTLLEDPRRAVAAREIAAIADADARENFELLIAFRDHLLAHPTLEAAYLALARNGVGSTPPLFLNQLVHVILRNALDGCDDPFVLRAAELMFRPQRLTNHEGALLAADEERIGGTGAMPVSPLVSMLGIPAAAEIDVLTEENSSKIGRAHV